MRRGLKAAILAVGMSMGVGWEFGGGPLGAAPPPVRGTTITMWVATGAARWRTQPLSLAPGVPAVLLPWATHPHWLPALRRAVRRDGTTRTTTRLALTLLIETAHPGATQSGWLSLTYGRLPVAVDLVARAPYRTAAWRHGHWIPWTPQQGWRWLPPPVPFPPPAAVSHPATCHGGPPRASRTLDSWTWEPDSRAWTWTYTLLNGSVVTCPVAAPPGLPRVTAHPGWAAAEAIGPLRYLAATDPLWVRHWWPAALSPDPTVTALLVLAHLSPTAWGDRSVTLHHIPAPTVQQTLRLLGWGPALATEVWPASATTPPPRSSAPSAPWELWAAGAAGLGGFLGGLRWWWTRRLIPRL